MDNIKEKEIPYVVSLSKYFKKQKDYNRMRKCCQELIRREPYNIGFKIKKLQASIKLEDKDGATDQLGNIKDMNQLT